MYEYKHLSAEQRQHFLDYGYVKIEGGIPPENVADYMKDIWVRLGWDPDDKSTWTKESVNLPSHRERMKADFMPKAWAAACEIVGGEDKFEPDLCATCGDGMVVNVGSEASAAKPQHPSETGGWHIDGDWYEHYLDSGEQALLTIMLFSDVEEGGGATLMSPTALRKLFQWLHDHPEGGYEERVTVNNLLTKDDDYIQATGKAGDVYLCHGFMPHSRARNFKRKFRAIHNPTSALKEPLNLNRPDGDYSLLEEKVLHDLGKSSLPDWHVTSPRHRWRPFTAATRNALVKDELDRMIAHSKITGVPVDSKHLRGEPMQIELLMKYPPQPTVEAQYQTAVAAK